MPQPLNSKDGASFRQLVKLYEAKQHKKAIKTADGILKKNPNHGDTMAMKALTLNAQGQTDEAFALAKQALQADMKSHICWHVYGLLYRSTNQLDEAIKAYKFALRLEPESQQIQRDLAFLQIQMRDYAGYIESRKAILQQRSALRQNWTALAVAHHLAGDLKQAEHLLKTYEETLKTPPPRSDYENQEASLYRNTVIAEMGDTGRALEHLESISKAAVDRTAVMELRAQYLLELGKKEEAEKAYRALIERNNEYRMYYEKLEETLGLSRENDKDKLAALYKELAGENPRIDAPLRIPLDFLEGDAFKAAADTYLKRMLAKGVPSTFANIKTLYSSSEKLAIIQDLVEGYASNPSGTANGSANGEKSTRFEEATYYFLAHHYDYHKSRDLSKAMSYVEKAIALDPKSVFYTMTKARIIKHTGDLVKASETMNAARELDEKDRYINTKCAKYQLRRDDNESAISTMSKFTRNETVGGALGDLHDMQCMWFITEDGESYLRQGKLSLALKRFKSVYDIFDVWQEDQFDFHQFSIRKGQIRAYVEMMRWEDRLREHPFYTRAALKAVKIYTMLHDEPKLAKGGLSNGVDLDGMDPAEKKKALKKAKKEAEKKAQEEHEKKEAANKVAKGKPGTGADGEPKKEDPDPQGLKLLETKTPLDEAVKFVTPLLELSPKNIEAQNAGFEVYIRRDRLLLALKCLIAAHAIDAEQSVLHEQLVRFRLALDKAPKSSSEKLDQVLKAHLSIVPETKDLKSFNDTYMGKHKDCARRTQAGLKVRQILDASSRSQNEKDLIGTTEKADVKEAQEGLQLLKEWKSEKTVIEDYKKKASGKWPEAGVFK